MSQSIGRGAHYHGIRSRVERVLTVLYRGDWPAKLWAQLPAARRVSVVQRQVALLPPSAATLRVGFISDIHIGPTTPPALLDNAFRALAEAQLDVLLLGGDYVFLAGTQAKAARLTQLVRRVPAARKFAVLGNHDLWTDQDLLADALRAADVRVLENEHVKLTDGLTLIGLDDPWVGQLDTARALAGIGAPQALLVLCHSPDGLPAARRALATLPGSPHGLYVCGHTHGGQIAAPWGPLLVPGKVGKRYPSGYHTLSPLDLYVSRGVGATELPIRSYAPPEVAVFELGPRAAVGN